MQGDAGKPGKPEESAKPDKEPPKAEKAAPKAGKEPPKDSPKAASNRRMLRIGIVVLALVVGLIAWIATQGDDGDSTPAPASAGLEAKIVSAEELEELAASAPNAIYWAGEMPGKELEASESSEGDFQVRYLDEGTEAGGGGAAVLTVGSYPLPDPVAAMEGFAERKGSLVRRSADGREVVTSAEKPTSVYFASSDGSVQVEVYDPSYKRAMSLALSAKVRPVG